MIKYLKILSLALVSSICYSTTFVPLTIKSQVKSSEAIVEGEVISIESERHNEMIVSKVSIRANKWLGLESDTGHFDLYYPGGKLAGEIQRIDGSPQFEIGEKVVVFAKSDQNKVWISNLGLGKFSLKNLGKEKILVNQIFPSYPEVGQIPLKSFYKLVEYVKNDKFKERFKDKYEINYEKEAKLRFLKRNSSSSGRAIASIDENDSHTEKFSVGWLVIFLGILGILFRIMKRKSS